MSDRKQALVRQQPELASPLAVMLADTDLIERVDVDKLERLLDMELKIRSQAAEQAFAEAKAECQREMQPVPERGWNDHYKAPYAYLRDIEAMLLPLLHKHGFSHSIGQDDASHASLFRVTLTATHKAGHSETAWVEVPLDTSGNKPKLHGVRSSRTYAARDLIESYWRIPLGASFDDDGNEGAGLSFPINATEAAEIKSGLKDAERTEEQLCAALGIESIDTMPSGKLAQARSLLAQAGAR